MKQVLKSFNTWSIGKLRVSRRYVAVLLKLHEYSRLNGASKRGLVMFRNGVFFAQAFGPGAVGSGWCVCVCVHGITVGVFVRTRHPLREPLPRVLPRVSTRLLL